MASPIHLTSRSPVGELLTILSTSLSNDAEHRGQGTQRQPLTRRRNLLPEGKPTGTPRTAITPNALIL